MYPSILALTEVCELGCSKYGVLCHTTLPSPLHSLTNCFCHFTWLEQWTLCGWDTRGRRRASAFTFISRWIYSKFADIEKGVTSIVTICPAFGKTPVKNRASQFDVEFMPPEIKSTCI